jgi:hypothetical protein
MKTIYISSTLTAIAFALVLASPQVVFAKGAGVHKSSGEFFTNNGRSGTYKKTTENLGDGGKEVVTDATFKNGATVDTTTIETVNSNGDINIDTKTVRTNDEGQQKVVYLDRQLDPTATKGDYTVTGEFTNAKGREDAVSGTEDVSDKGRDQTVDLVLTAKDGKTEDVDTTVTDDHGVEVADVTGTKFDGQTIDHQIVIIPKKDLDDNAGQ